LDQFSAGHKKHIDKVVKWILPIERKIEDDVDDYFITFPDDLLEAANLKPGDEIEWVDMNDGTFILRKPNVIETNS
jgi:bifunctional DNA-binding transcriptional regulator/antitoxin component of YhaV-PrlF toxin-antitoxin module